MSRRGGCRHCVWLSNGKTCASTKAMALTEKGRLKPFFGEVVKEMRQFWNHKLGRMEINYDYDGCFLYTRNDMKVQGVSGFLRRRYQ